MKKFLAIFLALLTASAVALTACNKKDKENDDENENWDNDYTYNYNVGTSANTGTGTGLNNDFTNNNTLATGSWIEKNDTVYVLQDVYLRSEPRANAKTNIALKQNDELKRISVQPGDSPEWAKVTYNEETYYVYAFIVSTSKVNFTAVERIATTVINSESGGNESSYFLRTTPCIASTYKWGDILNNAPLSVKKSDTEGGKLVITGYDAANECARVEYDADGAGEGAAKEYYVYAPCLEYYKNNGGTTGGVNPV